VSLTLDECLRTEQIERLRNQQLDIGFLRSALDGQDDLLVYPLLNEAMVAALPSDHPLVRNGRRHASLYLKELSDEQFIIYARQQGPAFYEATMAACLKAGFTPRLGQEAPRITSALSLVAVGLGVSLVPACLQNMTMNGVVYRRLKGVQPKAGLMLGLRRGDGSPVVRNFVQLVRKTASTFRPREDALA
jgi:DNA-binding transcriptional LysR family regulator